MIPNNVFTTSSVVTSFISPYNREYTPLEQMVLGGTMLNDPSLGREYKNWVVFYDDGEIKVKPESGSVVLTIPVLDVETVSLAFDNNMSPVVAWQSSTGSNLYYYDVQLDSVNTVFYPGTTSCRVVVDCASEFYHANSDVIFGYTLSSNLCWRQQRDRYAIERIVGPSGIRKLKYLAPSTGNRLQFVLSEEI